MTTDPRTHRLGVMLRARRRERRLSLRDLAEETGVSLNTLSRVERGHVPDLKNFQRIVDWLEVPTGSFLVDEPDPAATPEVIARHLRSDRLLTPDAAAEIAGMVAERYRRFVEERRVLEVQLRAAPTCTPEAGALLGEILSEVCAALEESEGD